MWLNIIQHLDLGISNSIPALCISLALLATVAVLLRNRMAAIFRPATQSTYQPIIQSLAFNPRSESIDGSLGETEPDAVVTFAKRRDSEVFVFAHGYRGREPRHAKDNSIGSEEVKHFLYRLHHIQRSNPLAKLDIIVHANSADISDAIQIARAIKAHPGETTVFIPYYAKGFASIIALAADNIVLDENAFIAFGASSLSTRVQASRKKWYRNLEDDELFIAQLFSKLETEIARTVCHLLHDGKHGDSCRVGKRLASGEFAETKVIDVSTAKTLGLPVQKVVPTDVFLIVQEFQTDPPQSLPATTPSSPQSRKSPLSSENGRSEEVEDEEDLDDFGLNVGVCAATCHAKIAPLIASMESDRNTSVFCLLHEKNMRSKSVDEISAVEILKFLRGVPADQAVDLILHTGGGLLTAGFQIAKALKRHRGKVTVFVPQFAYSAGTIIALAADEIVMSRNAVLGPIDTQIGETAAASYASLLRYKPASRIRAENLAVALQCKADQRRQLQNRTSQMAGVYSRGKADRIVRHLNDGHLSHGYPISFEESKSLGLRVRSDMPDEPMAIVEYFRNDHSNFCSVIHCSSN